MSSFITKIQAQRRLSVLWFVMAALPTALLGFNTLHGAGRFYQDSTAVWQWYSPFLFPTLLLMLGTLRSAETDAAPAMSSQFYFRLCFVLSVFYGLALLGTLLMALNNQAEGSRPVLETLKQASLPLTGVQSLLNLALGAFFVAAPHEPEPAPATKAGLAPTAE
ncbi:hypothetical protein [Hymenobacter terricola]|uniref:hypothetical protein n=1 Tax=Hymenobacter terricola TaxID=2819236 RepID=UPI001B3185E7|nr:hypothetical protein [Hymenobacter terricola]